MRKDQTFKAEADKKRDREALKARRANLAGLQQRLKQAGLPVIVLVEGWGAAGKGSVIRSLIRDGWMRRCGNGCRVACPSGSMPGGWRA